MNKVFVIAEAGVNHNGSLELALQLCDAAKNAKADAIKFQTWKTEKLLTRSSEMADYQKENTGKSISQFDMLKQLEIDYTDFIKLKKYCDDIGIRFLSTPDEEESLNFLLSIGIEYIKISSGEITNIPYLRKIGESRKKVILSTGMSYLGDVEKAYNTLLEAGASQITLLHCTTNYPCPVEEVNLRAMLTLKEAFKCEVGYSDHTLGIEIPIAAVAMGACLIEKHFTLDKEMEGPDHKASLNPDELKAMVIAIRKIEKALGNGIKKPSNAEIKNISFVRKSLVASKHINKGDLLTSENISVKRPGTGISPIFYDDLIGKRANKDYEVNDLINLE